jgi:DNA polymerase III subunit epsilon
MNLPLKSLSQEQLYNTSFYDLDYAVVDLETTGSKPGVSQIIEIGIVKIQNREIIDTYQTFVNPGTPIPEFITGMTGISDSDVEFAPILPDIAPKFLPMLDNSVFVAHNVAFDYNFLQKNLKLCGYEFASNKLCTVQLARKLLPQLHHHTLDDVAGHFHIEIPSRHRALDDALATGKSLLNMFDILSQSGKKIFGLMVDMCMPSESKKYQKLKPTIDSLPFSPGVYYMKNKDNQIIYVGKSKCLQKRVRSYFYSTEHRTRKLEKLIESVESIEHDTTGSELSALLHESKKIKEHLPIFNTMIRNYKAYPFLKISNEAFPRIYTVREIKPDGATYYGPFKSSSALEHTVANLKKAFFLRPCKGKINPNKPETMKLCMYYELGECPGVCGGKMSQEEYLGLIEKAKAFLSGNEHAVINRLQLQIDEASENLAFEKAADLRDNVIALERILTKQQRLNNCTKDNNVLIIEDGLDRHTKEVFCIKNGNLHTKLIATIIPKKETTTTDINQSREQYRYSYLQKESLFEDFYAENYAEESTLDYKEYSQYQERKQQEQFDIWKDTINKIYSPDEPEIKITKENIDDLMIISTWLMQNNSSRNVHYVRGKENIEKLAKQLSTKYSLG